MSIFISERKLKVGESYKSGLSGGTIVPATNKVQLESAISLKIRQNSHYETKGCLYFNNLDKDMVCFKVEKVV